MTPRKPLTELTKGVKRRIDLSTLEESATQTGTKNASPIWHSFHNDQSQDMILKGHEGVLLSASKHRLSLNSDMFAGLFASAKPDSNKNPIEFSFMSTSIATFLDLIAVPSPITPTLQVREADDFQRFINFIDAPESLVKIADTVMSRAVQCQPIISLTIASERDDLVMAKAAFRAMTTHRVQALFKSVESFQRLLGRLRPEWRLALLKRSLVKDLSAEGGIRLKPKWAESAEEGFPVKGEI